VSFAEYHKYDGLGLAELVRTRQIAASELVDEAIRRIEAHNPSVNAVVYPMYEQARAAARGVLPDGPFTGVPFLLKDLHSTCAGIPTSSGNRLLRGIPMPHDSEIVRRFKAAGVVLLGKTNTPEFGLTPFTESEALGAARNPWDLSRTPGGSSGGAGAAVAARMVPLAGASDGGGSIRIPASCCGVFGLKPTRGRTPWGPDYGEVWHGLAIENTISISVRDSAAMLDAIAGPDVGAPYEAPPQARPFLEEAATEPGRLRIAFTGVPFLGHATHPDCLKGLAATVALLRRLGHEVIEAAPEIDRDEFAVAFLTLVATEARADIEHAAKLGGRAPALDDFEVGTYAVGLLGHSMRASDYVKAMRALQGTGRVIGRFFETCDVLLTPTLAQPPVPIGALKTAGGQVAFLKIAGRLNAGWLLHALGVINALAAKAFDFSAFTPLFNVSGQPAMSVPLAWNDDGLPIGMQFVGRFGDEATLFRLAGQLERAQPWFSRRPALDRPGS
jgi:amidase